MIQGAVIGHRAHAVIARFAGGCAFATFTDDAGERQVDAAKWRHRSANHYRPLDLF